MRYSILIAILALAWAGLAQPVEASSDGGCRLEWKLVHAERSACSNMAILHPGNDTRTNLILLLQDEMPAPEVQSGGNALFGWQELLNNLYPMSGPEQRRGYRDHSRCQTNESGAQAFAEAVAKASRLKKGEADLLVAVRNAVGPDCSNDEEEPEELARLSEIRSKTGKAFAEYLRSAVQFYNGDFNDATIGFSGIVKSRIKDAWLQETALYMIARSELNRSQQEAFGRYGWFEMESVDRGAIANAERGFNLYIEKYPDGQYASSARGLLRRVYWLSGDAVQLSREYAGLLRDPEPMGLRTSALVAEIDHKLLPMLAETNVAEDPMLAAMILLYRMRAPGYDIYGDARRDPITSGELNAFRATFADRPRLFAYLQGVHAFYVAGEPARVIELIPDDARRSEYGYLAFSRQALRGMALEAVGDRNARGFWQQLIGGATRHGQRRAVELALAMNLERGGDLDQLFASDSMVTDQSIRDILLLRSTGPKLLRQQATNRDVTEHERNLALYTLLYKNLTRGRYSEFLEDIKLVQPGPPVYGPYYGFQYEYDYGYEYGSEEGDKVPVGMFSQPVDYDRFACPQLQATVTTLVRNRRDHTARICLAEYMRIAGFDDYWLDDPVPEGELGGAKSQFAGTPYSRLETYKQLIAERSTPANVRAYALYRAVWCYGPSGNNSCGGTEVPTSQRRAWFRQLKRSYPNSRWARQLKYYW